MLGLSEFIGRCASLQPHWDETQQKDDQKYRSINHHPPR
jgi:hypothetical protein